MGAFQQPRALSRHFYSLFSTCFLVSHRSVETARRPW
jgi:hypothetical protein